MLGPPRCCICQNKNKKVLFSGEVYWDLHALKKLWVLEQIGLWILRSKTWKYISTGQEKAREDDSPSRQAQSKWSENFVRDLCFFLISIVMWQSSILGIERSTLDEKVSTEELVQRLSLAFLCLWVASAILPSLSFLLARSKITGFAFFLSTPVTMYCFLGAQQCLPLIMWRRVVEKIETSERGKAKCLTQFLFPLLQTQPPDFWEKKSKIF